MERKAYNLTGCWDGVKVAPWTESQRRNISRRKHGPSKLPKKKDPPILPSLRQGSLYFFDRGPEFSTLGMKIYFFLASQLYNITIQPIQIV
jgi:hypothetical protein